MMTCLDEETTLGLVEGRLAAAALDAAEAHLDGCESCRDVVTQLAKASAPPSRELAAGQQLGKYVVGELLGAGAMGQVYAAHQVELDRKVAIKVLHDTASSDRLLKEAQAMARLDHPNVVGVYEVGTLDDGGVYAVMDLVEGDTLRVWAEPKREWRELTRVLVEVARGLAAVHAAGVIHRDIKPDNIIVGADGRVRLGDFGLARGEGTKVRPGRLVDSASFDDTVVASPSENGIRGVGPVARSNRGVGSAGRAAELGEGGRRAAPELGEGGRTTGTAVAGTPVYMALELLQGRPATPASDQFAFGVTAYELIAGNRPFRGNTWDELARSVATDPPIPLRDVPRWLDAAIRRCLAVDPDRRFPSLSAVASHLEQHAQRRKPLWIAGAAAAAIIASGVTFAATRGGEHAPVAGPSCALGANEIAQVWNPGVRDGVAKLGGSALVGIDGWTARWAAERDATCAAASSATVAKTAARDRCLTLQRDELTALLDRSKKILASGRFDDTGTPLPPRTPTTESAGSAMGPRLPTLTDRSTDDTADLLLDVLAGMSPAECEKVEPGAADPLPTDSDHLALARKVARALPAVRAALALADGSEVLLSSRGVVEDATQSGHAPTIAEALLVRGEVLRAAEKFDAAATSARDAVAAAERGHDDQLAAQAWLLRVGIAVDRRDLAGADDLAALADANVDRAGAPPRLVARLLRLRGTVAYYRGRLADARALLTKAREHYTALSGEKSLDVAGIETMLGATARVSGDLAQAERHHRNALAIDRELRGPDHVDLSRDLHNLAGVLRLKHDLEGATATYYQALDIEIRQRGARSVQAGLTHNSLGLVKLERRDLAGARTEFTRALELLTETMHGDRAFAEANLGLVDAATNQHAAALVHYDRASAIYASTIGDTAVASIRIHLDRALSLAALGRRDQARASATKALDAAVLADVSWIASDAKALLATLGTRTTLTATGVDVQPAGPSSTTPVVPPIGPTTLPPQPPPDPKRDVGTYGSNPGRP